MPVTLIFFSICNGVWGMSLRKTACEDCQDDEARSQSRAHHSSHDDKRYGQNEKISE